MMVEYGKKRGQGRNEARRDDLSSLPQGGNGKSLRFRSRFFLTTSVGGNEVENEETKRAVTTCGTIQERRVLQDQSDRTPTIRDSLFPSLAHMQSQTRISLYKYL